jgi:hypothetical protein
MRNAVTVDRLARLMAAMNTTMIATPIGIANQTDIVSSCFKPHGSPP